jgi:octaprenyl-diphosphate synthase
MKIAIDQGLKNALKPELARLNDRLESLARETDGYLGDLRSYVLIGSGKRVRPALVTLYSQLGNADPEAVQTVSLAVELVHIATLVHDDVIDKAAMRRGRKTVAAEHGTDAAVLLGDHVYTWAFEKVAELNNPKILGLLARSTSVMCAGEIDQLKRRFQFDLTEEEYFSFIYKKTASLFGTSARSGAILAGQSEEIQASADRFGTDLGMAFQIIDDLLDLTGEEAVVGKTLHTDLMNGKMTLPLIYLRDHLGAGDARSLTESLQHPNGQIPELVERMRVSGAIDYSQRVAGDHLRSAMDQLEKLPVGAVRDNLTSLAETLQRRQA